MDQISPNEFKAIEAKNKTNPFLYAIMSDNHLYSDNIYINIIHA